MKNKIRPKKTYIVLKNGYIIIKKFINYKKFVNYNN